MSSCCIEKTALISNHDLRAEILTWSCARSLTETYQISASYKHYSLSITVKKSDCPMGCCTVLNK